MHGAEQATSAPGSLEDSPERGRLRPDDNLAHGLPVTARLRSAWSHLRLNPTRHHTRRQAQCQGDERDSLQRLFPHAPDARSWFAGNAASIEATAFRNSSLQGAYFMLAARAIGLDCGPMSGFDAAKIDAEFFPDGKFKVNFVCNLGHGDATKLFGRSPRLSFEEACKIL